MENALKIYRFPRYDEKGRDLIRQMAEAQKFQDLDKLLHCTRRLEAHALDLKRRYGSMGLLMEWDDLPRFDSARVSKTRWLIENFVAEGNIQLVYGEPGSFKSTMLLWAARAVASSRNFLGMKTCCRRVLYLDYENPANVIRARSKDLRLDLPSNPNLVIWDRSSAEPPSPFDPRLPDLIANCKQKTGHGVWLIIDSWSSV